MTKRALIVMADGCEDIETVAPIDILNRAGVAVTIASLSGNPVKAAYGNTLVPHLGLDKIGGLYDCIIFPGGKKNAESLAASSRVVELAREHLKAGKIVAAICAAPSHVLAEAAGILQNIRATGDPSFNDRLAKSGAKVTGEKVTVDGNIVTAMGPGAAMEFGLTLAGKLAGKDIADQFAQKWQIRY